MKKSYLLHFKKFLALCLTTGWAITASACPQGLQGPSCQWLDGASPPQSMRVQVSKPASSGSPAVTRTFNLERYDVTRNLEVVLVDASGNPHAVASPSVVRTYQGYCEEESGAMVSATVLPNGTLGYRVHSGDSSADWEYVPPEDAAPASLPYTVVSGPARAPAGKSWPGATPWRSGQGGLLQNGTTYTSQIGFVIPQEYLTKFGNDIDMIVRRAQTTVAQLNTDFLRNLLFENKLSSLLIRADTTPEAVDARTDMARFGITARPNRVFSVNGGAGWAYVCFAGGGSSALQDDYANRHSQGVAGTTGTGGLWYGVLRHELGHAMGSNHFSGGSPEGATIMSGNTFSRFSSYEAIEIENCANQKQANLARYDSSSRFHTAFAVPPYARLDDNIMLSANGEANIDVLANDFDANDDPIALSSFDEQTAVGGTLRFLPAAKNHFGRDSLSYRAPTSLRKQSSASCGAPCESANLMLWLDASDLNSLHTADGKSGTTLGDLARIDSWHDKRGNGFRAQANYAERRPTLLLSGQDRLGERPTLLFDNSSLEVRDIDLREETHPVITSIAVARHIAGQGDYGLWVQTQNGFQKRKHGFDGNSKMLATHEMSANGPEQHWYDISQYEQRNRNITSAQAGIALGHYLHSQQGYTGAYFSNMHVAELLIFNRALQANERQAVELYLAKKWQIGITDRASYTIVDSTGRTNRADIVIPLIEPAPPKSLIAMTGAPRRFDGQNSYVELPHAQNHSAKSAITLSARIFPTAFSGNAGILVKGKSATPWALGLAEDGALTFTANDNVPHTRESNFFGFWRSSLKLSLNEWHDVSVTYDGLHVRFYVDRQLDRQQYLAEGLEFGSVEEPLVTGRNFLFPDGGFTGEISQTRMWPMALTPQQIMMRNSR